MSPHLQVEHPQMSTDRIPIRCRYCTLESSSAGRTRKELRDCQVRLLQSQNDHVRSREHINRLQQTIFTLQEHILDLYAQSTLPAGHGPEAPSAADEGFEDG